jgi:type I restriction enzyme R subunit
MLVRNYLEEHGSGQDKEIRAAIDRAVDSSPSLRNKKELIDEFVDSLTVDAEVDDEWQQFVARKRSDDLGQIIAEEGLNADATLAFMDSAFRDGALASAGTAITAVIPPTPRFGKANVHAAKKQTVLEKLGGFFERYVGLS